MAVAFGAKMTVKDAQITEKKVKMDVVHSSKYLEKVSKRPWS
jgi:hypothetical protein